MLDREPDEEQPDGLQAVDGWRLASALCLLDSRPAVVSLAACDGANIGSVHDRTGASIAHSLHQEGVTLVVASQFPLMTEGSVVLTRELYGGLFRGTDPRIVRHDVRTALHRRSGMDHDWASVVAYAAFPPALAAGLEKTTCRLARFADNRAYAKISATASEATVDEARWGKLEKLLEAAIERYPSSGRYAAEGTGMRGSGFKRLARAAFLFSQAGRDSERLDDCVRYLGQARDYYDDAARLFMTPRAEDGPQSMASLHWVLTQHLSLRAVLGRFVGDGEHRPGADQEGLPARFWWSSWANAHAHLERGLGDDTTWAYASMAELCLLQLSLADSKRVSDVGLPAGSWSDRAALYARRMLEAEGDHRSWRIGATRGAFERYTNEWWMNKRLVEHLEKCGFERSRDWNKSGLVPAARRVVRVLTPR